MNKMTVNEKAALLESLLRDDEIHDRLSNALKYYADNHPYVKDKLNTELHGGITYYNCDYNEKDFTVIEDLRKTDADNYPEYTPSEIGFMPIHIMLADNYKQLIDELIGVVVEENKARMLAWKRE